MATVIITEPSSTGSSSRPLTPIEELDADATIGHQSPSSSASPASPANSVMSTVNFHVDSDAVVIVNKDGGKVHYEVSSCSIALASSVWCSMLYGQDSKERPAKGEWSIALEDDGKALDTIFRIVHYEFSKVPTNPSLEDLFEIARVVSRYECTHLIHPWADQWLGGLRHLSFIDEDSFNSRCHKAIWIAWVFGAIKLFEHMTNSLIFICRASTDGRLVNRHGIPLKDMVLPPGVLDTITDIRMSAIAKMLKVVDRYVKHLTSGWQDSNVSYCKVGKDMKECEAMMLGSVLPKLVQAGLYPVPKGSDVTHSIQELAGKLCDIEAIPYVGRDWMPHQSHEPCCFVIRELVSECAPKVPSPLKDDYLEHLFLQAKVSGVKGNDSYPVSCPISVTDSASATPSKSESLEIDVLDGDIESGGTDLRRTETSEMTDS